jgi:hypothetical protein
MTFQEILAQVGIWIEYDKRPSYRALQRWHSRRGGRGVIRTFLAGGKSVI